MTSSASALWYFDLMRSSVGLALAPGAPWLLAAYLTTFMAAEGAFVVMAIKEYMQDVLGLTDAYVLHQLYGVRVGRRRPRNPAGER